MVCKVQRLFFQYIFFLFFVLISTQLLGQNAALYPLKSGKISFFSYANLEVIKASSVHLKGLINPEQNTFAVTVENNSFIGFNSDLQREHFNERYIESAKYEFCSYSGKIIEKIDWTKDGKYIVRAKGKLIIHGVSQERVIKITIQIKGNEVNVLSVFNVVLSDHEINIPAIVNQKIAEEIMVEFMAMFVKK
jgi:hypothetical protein